MYIFTVANENTFYVIKTARKAAKDGFGIRSKTKAKRVILLDSPLTVKLLHL